MITIFPSANAKQLLIYSPKADPDMLSIILFPNQFMTGQMVNPVVLSHPAVLWPHPSCFCFSFWTELQDPAAEDNIYNISHIVIL